MNCSASLNSCCARLASTAAVMLVTHHRMVAHGGHFGLGGGSALWDDLERDLTAWRAQGREPKTDPLAEHLQAENELMQDRHLSAMQRVVDAAKAAASDFRLHFTDNEQALLDALADLDAPLCSRADPDGGSQRQGTAQPTEDTGEK